MEAPLAWYIAGPLIGLIVPLLLLIREKQFGISSSYRYIWALMTPKISYFNYKRGQDQWQIHFALGLILSGLLDTQFLELAITETEYDYQKIAHSVYELDKAWIYLVGGIFVGFGARYANGCTAGHCIMGVSQFAKSSILATIAFFAGGSIATHVINPLIFKL